MTPVETGFDPLTLVGSAEGARWAVFVWGDRGPFTAIAIGLDDVDDPGATRDSGRVEELLQAVVRRIGATIPPIPDSFVGRIDPGTFLVLVALPDVREAAMLAQRLLEAIEAPLPIGVDTIRPCARLVVVPVRVGPSTPMTLPGLPSSWSIGGRERSDLFKLVRAALRAMPRDGDAVAVLDRW
jgi:GGDEF domain-containing protein